MNADKWQVILTSKMNVNTNMIKRFTIFFLIDSFDLIPLSCVVNGRFLAIHGGISPDMKNLEDIAKIDRFNEPPRYDIFFNILWSDPVENKQGKCEKMYKSNEVRGCSYFYEKEAVKKFLTDSGLISIIRAHEAQYEGY